MTGDQDDMLSRLKMLLPARWFGDSSPVLDAILSCFSWSLAFVYSLIQYAKNQTRIATATDGFLDLISYDYFGSNLPRRSGEQDDPFRQRILATLLREKTTRKGMTDTLTTLTGRAPDIFEPARPKDTGAYNVSTSGYGAAGRYGSLKLPYQAFVVAYRPSSSGIPRVAGYNRPRAGYSTASYSKYSNISQIIGFVTDADIFAAVSSAKPEGTIVWTRLSN